MTMEGQPRGSVRQADLGRIWSGSGGGSGVDAEPPRRGGVARVRAGDVRAAGPGKFPGGRALSDAPASGSGGGPCQWSGKALSPSTRPSAGAVSTGIRPEIDGFGTPEAPVR